MRERVQVYKDGDFKMISEEEVATAKKDLLKYGNEWKKRKRNCNDIIDAICEGADLNKKDFIVSIVRNNSDRKNWGWSWMRISK